MPIKKAVDGSLSALDDSSHLPSGTPLSVLQIRDDLFESFLIVHGSRFLLSSHCNSDDNPSPFCTLTIVCQMSLALYCVCSVKKTSSTTTYHVVVFELNDVVPRRDLRRPNLYVGKSTRTSHRQLEFEAVRSKPQWYSHEIVTARDDLAPRTHFRSSEAAARATKNVIGRLKSLGYTVNRDVTVWSLYVVELDKAASNDCGRGCVYVGETTLSPEERFAQHREGARNAKGPLFARTVHRHGLRLRPDLAPRRKYFDRSAARRAEAALAERLKERGYVVRGGH